MLYQGEMEKVVIASVLASALSLYQMEAVNTAEGWRAVERVHRWSEFDYVVPLTTRRMVQPEPECNRVESYDIKVAKAEDKTKKLYFW